MKKNLPVNISVDLLKDDKLLRKRPRVELGKLDISEGPVNAASLDGKKPQQSETDVPKPEKKTPVKINVEHLKDRKLLRMKPRVELKKLGIRKSPMNVLKLDGKKTLAERNPLKTNMPVKIDVELLKDEKIFRMKPQVALEKLVVDKKPQNITQSKEKKKPPIKISSELLKDGKLFLTKPQVRLEKLNIVEGPSSRNVKPLRKKPPKRKPPVKIGLELLKDKKLFRREPRVMLGALDVDEIPQPARLVRNPMYRKSLTVKTKKPRLVKNPLFRKYPKLTRKK